MITFSKVSGGQTIVLIQTVGNAKWCKLAKKEQTTMGLK